MASATAKPPSWGAVKEARAPWNLPIAERHAETMTGRPMTNVIVGLATARANGDADPFRHQILLMFPDERPDTNAARRTLLRPGAAGPIWWSRGESNP